jgi:hypothetical protein
MIQVINTNTCYIVEEGVIARVLRNRSLYTEEFTNRE